MSIASIVTQKLMSGSPDVRKLKSYFDWTMNVKNFAITHSYSDMGEAQENASSLSIGDFIAVCASEQMAETKAQVYVLSGSGFILVAYYGYTMDKGVISESSGTSSGYPAYIDDILEFDSVSEFPAIGKAGKLYVIKDTGVIYYWNGIQYVKIADIGIMDEINAKAEASVVNVLIGGDIGKSVRTIANEELVKQLVPANARVSLDTLQKISAWIQSHPDEVAALNAKLTLVTNAGVEYPTVKAYVEAITAGLIKLTDLSTAINGEGNAVTNVSYNSNTGAFTFTKGLTFLSEHQDISGKVDKVVGKGLSTNDYTDADKTKLDGMESGANATVIDDTLSNSGDAADAKATGDALAALESENALLRELVNGIDAPIYRTASGNPATFSDGYAANVKALSVTLAPSQSGSGDPYPPGGGKNLFDESAVEIGTAWNGNHSTARARLALTCLPNATYTLSIHGVNDFEGVYYALSDTRIPSGVNYISAFPLTFTTGGDDTYLTLGFNKANVTAGDIASLKAQLELGSTATDYAPYANVRPVSGSSSVSVTRTGKNLLRPALSASVSVSGVTFTHMSDGTLKVAGTATADIYRRIASVAIAQSGTYRLTGLPSGASPYSFRMYLYNSPNITLNGTPEGANRFLSAGFTTTAYISVASGYTINETFYPMLRLYQDGDDTFTPYQEQSVTVRSTSQLES